MATPRTSFTLAVLVVLGLGYLYFFEGRLESTDEHAVSQKRMLHVHANQIQSIAFRRDNWTNVAIERIDGATWKRTAPIPGAVDSALIGELCSDLEFGEHSTTLEGHGGDTQHLYDEGLSPPALTVTLTLADHRELAFEFGKETPTADGVYFHVQDDPNVQIVNKLLRDRFNSLVDALNDTSGAGAADNPKPDQTKSESHGSD